MASSSTSSSSLCATFTKSTANPSSSSSSSFCWKKNECSSGNNKNKNISLTTKSNHHHHHHHHHRRHNRRRATVVVATSAEATGEGDGLILQRGKGELNAFDSIAIGSPIVKYFQSDDDTERWVMWYTGRREVGTSGNNSEENVGDKITAAKFDHDKSLTSGEIGIAVSEDGIVWRRGGSPTETYRTGGDAEAFENLSVDVGAVLYPNNEDWWVFDTAHVSVGDVHMISSGNVSGGAGGGIYWMYYQGGDKEEVDGVEGVRTRPGLCLSQDGRNWARIEGEHHTHAVLDVGSEGEWDELCIRDPKLLLAGPKDMRLFYHSIDKTTDVSRIGVATSKDGFQWQKNSSGFILDAGPEGSIDDLGVKSPCVARIGRNEYVMFYEALSSKHPGKSTICVAKSQDGIKWERASTPALVFGEDGAWDEGGVGRPYVVPMAENKLRLYYEGRSDANGLGVGIGLAVSVGDDMFSFVRRKSVVTAA